MSPVYPYELRAGPCGAAAKSRNSKSPIAAPTRYLLAGVRAVWPKGPQHGRAIWHRGGPFPQADGPDVGAAKDCAAGRPTQSPEAATSAHFTVENSISESKYSMLAFARVRGDAALSIAKFIASPLSYTKAHVVQFSHGAFPPAQAGMQITATINNWGGAWKAEEYQRLPGQFTGFRFIEAGIQLDGSSANQRIGKGSTALHTIRVEPSAVDLGVRFLPWKADTVTYMTLDGAAQTFFTGPLSGCSIFIGRVGTTPWVFHANRNNAGGIDNSAIKASMTTGVILTLPAPVPIICEAIYKRDYKDFGFVFGEKKGTDWKFYCADTSPLPSGKGAAQTIVRELK